MSISPSQDVGPSLVSSDQIELAIGLLGETPLVAKPIDSCSLDEKTVVVLCENSMHIMSVTPTCLVDLIAADVPRNAQTVLSSNSDNLFAVIHDKSINAYRVMLDAPSGPELLHLWKHTGTSPVVSRPSIVSNGGLAWLEQQNVESKSYQLLAYNINSEVRPAAATLCTISSRAIKRTSVSAALVLDNDRVAVGYKSGILGLADMQALHDSGRLAQSANLSLHSPIRRIWAIKTQASELLLACSESGQIGLWQQQ